MFSSHIHILQNSWKNFVSFARMLIYYRSVGLHSVLLRSSVVNDFRLEIYCKIFGVDSSKGAEGIKNVAAC